MADNVCWHAQEASAAGDAGERPPFPDSILADRDGAPKVLQAIEHSMSGIVDKVGPDSASGSPLPGAPVPDP